MSVSWLNLAGQFWFVVIYCQKQTLRNAWYLVFDVTRLVDTVLTLYLCVGRLLVSSHIFHVCYIKSNRVNSLLLSLMGGIVFLVKIYTKFYRWHAPVFCLWTDSFRSNFFCSILTVYPRQCKYMTVDMHPLALCKSLKLIKPWRILS